MTSYPAEPKKTSGISRRSLVVATFPASVLHLNDGPSNRPAGIDVDYPALRVVCNGIKKEHGDRGNSAVANLNRINIFTDVSQRTTLARNTTYFPCHFNGIPSLSPGITSCK